MGHFAEALEFIPGPLAAGGEFWIFSQGKGLGLPDEMGETGLAQVCPLTVDSVVVADEYAVPVADEFCEGFLGAVGVDHEKGDQRTHHHPEPVEFAAVLPGSFIEVVDGSTAGLVPDGFVVREGGSGRAVDELLDGAEADADTQHGGAEGTDGVAAISRNTGNFGDQRGESWPEAVAVFMGNIALADFSTGGAAALEEDEVPHRQEDLGQFDILMGIIGLMVAEFDASACTGTGVDRRDVGGLKQGLAIALVPLAGSWFAFAGRFGFCSPVLFGKGFIRGWRTVGGGGVEFVLSRSRRSAITDGGTRCQSLSAISTPLGRSVLSTVEQFTEVAVERIEEDGLDRLSRGVGTVLAPAAG